MFCYTQFEIGILDWDWDFDHSLQFSTATQKDKIELEVSESNATRDEITTSLSEKGVNVVV